MDGADSVIVRLPDVLCVRSTFAVPVKSRPADATVQGVAAVKDILEPVPNIRPLTALATEDTKTVELMVKVLRSMVP